MDKNTNHHPQKENKNKILRPHLKQKEKIEENISLSPSHIQPYQTEEEKQIYETTEDENAYANHIVAIIPCYNEDATIGSVITKAKLYAHEIVIVDDGSTDDTKKIAEALGATVISHQIGRASCRERVCHRV